MTSPRSDLALEAAQLLARDKKIFSSPGIKTAHIWRDGYEMTDIRVTSSRGAAALGKPKGRYVTLDLRPYFRREAQFFPRAVRCLARELRRLLPPGQPGCTLVVGLGNRSLAAAAIGPMAVENLLVTRHLRAGPGALRELASVAALCPGVAAATGMETLELLTGAAAAIRPGAIVCIDALCARARERLCATVQLSDTGLVPGSGVGNHRRAIDRDALGVPVIALGVPTVIDAGEGGDPLFVTPGDIDSRVRELGRILGCAITQALQPSLTLEDIMGLLG